VASGITIDGEIEATDERERAGGRVDRADEAARGYIYPEWELAARQDPEFVEAYNRIYELGLGEGRHVSAKVREFVAIALLAFRGAEKAGLVAHMKRAIRLGATKEELFEVLETCLVPGGAPTFHRGLSALLEVDDDESR
jgi:alkylhydroperoxidase/carboxymuconolactone decarboxylase family protein YurZ